MKLSCREQVREQSMAAPELNVLPREPPHKIVPYFLAENMQLADEPLLVGSRIQANLSFPFGIEEIFSLSWHLAGGYQLCIVAKPLHACIKTGPITFLIPMDVVDRLSFRRV